MEEKKENNSSSSGFGIFVTAIVLAVLYPPYDWYEINYVNTGGKEKIKNFYGWDFFWNLGGSRVGRELNITYLIIEIAIICIIYFGYRASRK
jgi:hypothetical protein